MKKIEDMRVLVVTPDLRQPGGVTNYYNALKLDEYPNIDYFYANKANTDSYAEKIYSFVFIFVKFLVGASRCQLIHVNPSLNPKSFYRDLIFVLSARVMRKKVIVFFRGWEDEFESKIVGNRILTILFRASYAKADAFIVLGELFKEKLIKLGVAAEKPCFVETTVADSRYLNKLDLQKKIASFEECVNFLFMSRILESKGIYIATEAFDRCQRQLANRKMALYVAGDGDELPQVREYVERKGISNVVFTGNVTDLEKHEMLNKSHIMLFPTFYAEGMPNCILEGMLYGLPIVSRINAAIPSVVEHGKNGFLTTSKNSEVFSNYCMDIISDKPLYKVLAQENCLKARMMFTTESVRSRILAIYTDVLGRKEQNC